MRFHQRTDDLWVEVTNPPEANDPSATQGEAAPGVTTPTWMREQGAIRTELDSGLGTRGFGVHPFLGFLESTKNKHAEKSGGGADKEHHLPSLQSER